MSYPFRNYTSPYGFGPVTDMVLDCVAERHGVEVEDIIERLELEDPDGYGTIRDWIDNGSWDQVLGPAVDKFDERLFPQDQT